MSLDNPTAPSAAASEPPAAPLDGIELAGQGAAEHLPDGPAEAAAAARISALPAASANDGATAAATVSESAENSKEKQRGRPFEPGQSGNPNGRPKGARNSVTRALEALIDGRRGSGCQGGRKDSQWGFPHAARAAEHAGGAPARTHGRIRIAED